MLNIDIYHTNQCLSLVLPLPIEVLAGELRAFHVEQTMDHITQEDFTLTPANELGEHFMKLVQPDDTLQAIATYCRTPDTLRGGARQALVDLIMADRFRDLDHMHDYLQYGPDALHGLIRMTRDGRSVLLPTKEINMYHCFGPETPMGLTRLAEMELAPVSELGRRLMAKFQPYSDTAAIANLACELVKIPAFAQMELSKFVEGVRVFQMPMDTETMNFFCPMIVQRFDGDDEDPIELGNDYLAIHEEKVRAAVLDMIDYGAVTGHLPDELQGKITSIRWDIAKIGGEVYGKITAEIRAPLTAAEQEKLAGWIYDQNEGAHGDGFEQLLVDTDDGELCVSFWNSSPDCYVLPEDEFRAQVLGEQPQDSQGMGGMGGMA